MPGDGNAGGERGNCMSRPITDAQAAEIHRLRDEGYSPYQVAKMTGHTIETINNHWYDPCLLYTSPQEPNKIIIVNARKIIITPFRCV